MVVPLRGCASCSRGSLKVKLNFLFCRPALVFLFCHPEFISGSILSLKTKDEIPDQARNDRIETKDEIATGSKDPSQWRLS